MEAYTQECKHAEKIHKNNFNSLENRIHFSLKNKAETNTFKMNIQVCLNLIKQTKTHQNIQKKSKH